MNLRPLTFVAACLAAMYLPAATTTRAESIREDLSDFKAGKAQRTSTQGRPGADGMNLSVAYPVTWQEIAPVDSQIIRQCVHRIDDRVYSFSINVTPAGSGLQRISQQDAKQFFEMKTWAEIAAPPPCVIHSRSTIRFEGFPAGRIEFSQAMDGQPGRMRHLGVMFIRDSQMVLILASVVDPGGDQRRLDVAFEEARPLFQAMFDGMILHNVWMIPNPPGTPFDRGPDNQPGRIPPPRLSADEHRIVGLTDGLLLSLFVPVLLGMVPAAVVRFAVYQAPLKQKSATRWALGITVAYIIGTVALLFLIEFRGVYFGAPWLVVAIGSYALLRWGPSDSYAKYATSAAGQGAPSSGGIGPPMIGPPPPMTPPIAQAYPAAPPQYGTPQYGTPQYGTPQYGTPQYGTPPYGASPYGAPSYGTPQYAAPQHSAPPYAAPVEYGHQAYGGPQGYGAPQAYPGQQPYGTAAMPSPAPPYPAATPVPQALPLPLQAQPPAPQQRPVQPQTPAPPNSSQPPGAGRTPPALPPKKPRPPGSN